MNRKAFTGLILERYDVEPDCPWPDDPDSWVFRHRENRKWFALIMRIPENRLGRPGEGLLDIVNLKCAPLLIGSLRGEPGFFPAYHMSKENWISAALDGSASDETLTALLEMSYEATRPRLPKKKKDRPHPCP